MQWIRFDEADRRTSAPSFCLPSFEKDQVCLGDYHEDASVVLVFLNPQAAETADAFLSGFADRRLDYHRADAKVLAVFPESAADLRSRVEADPRLASLSIALAADPQGKVREVYAGLVDPSLVDEEDLLVYLLDSYSAPYFAFAGAEFNEETLHQDTLKWLQYIGLQCPE